MKTRRWTTAAALAAVQMSWTQLLLVLALSLATLHFDVNSPSHHYVTTAMLTVCLLLTMHACREQMNQRNALRLCLCLIQALPGLIITLKIAGWAGNNPRLAPAIFGWELGLYATITGVTWACLTVVNRRTRPTVD